ncbi:MAG: 16S rRNA (adenine(1518)-N(6)/adenine(1519)-N(6))-dimethyltransferase RsmA [Bacteroidota bacterium]
MAKLRPKKHLGQHFLRDQRAAARIVEALSVPPETPVAEIGPGEGVLTHRLRERYPALQVVEIDPDAVTALKRDFADRLTIVHQDVLTWDMSQGLRQNGALIGNLPYNISSPFFFHMLAHHLAVREGVFMIQKEVAKRICADPGSKIYGLLSVLIGAYYERQYLFDVPPGAFRPPPKVMSGVIRLERKAVLPKIDFDVLRKLTKAAFGQRRKTLRNALKAIPLDDHPDWTDIAPQRAEQLPVETFLDLAKFWEEKKKSES